MPAWNGLYHRNDFTLDEKPMTATEVSFRLSEMGRSEAMKRLEQVFSDMAEQVIERIITTPIQFKFPRSKKKRIRKKWRKDPKNFRKLVDDGFPDIQIVGMGERHDGP
jgi:hypothetical protein